MLLLHDPDVSSLSDDQLEQLLQSLPEFEKNLQPGLTFQDASFFTMDGSFSLSNENASGYFPLSANLNDINTQRALSPCSSGSEDHDHSLHEDESVGGQPSPLASPPIAPTTRTTSKPARVNKKSVGKRAQKYTRHKTGCLCCRQKRVKCGEEHPSCKRCVNAGRDCIWPTPASNEDGGAANSGSDRGSSVAGGESPEKHTVALPVARGSQRSVRGVGRGVARALSTRPQVAITTEMNASSSQSSYSGANLSVPSSTSSARSSVSAASPGASPSFNWDVAFPSLDQGVNISPVSTFNSAVDNNLAGFSASAPVALLPWFPTAEERGLILHFCQNSSSLLMATPSTLNPVFSVLLPLALSAPRGYSAPVDALRLSLLCVSATHQAYLLSRALAPPAILSKALDLAIGLRSDARVLIKSVPVEGAVQGEAADALLAAAVMMGVVDVMLGGHSWTENFKTAKAIVEARGGPDAIVASGTLIVLAEGITVSRPRLMLEILAAHEIFASLVSDQGTTPLISQGTWWQPENQLSYHTISVENHFGVSRPVLGLLAEATALITRASLASCTVTERSEDEASSFLFLEAFADEHSCESEPDVVGIRRDANELLQKIEAVVAAGALGEGRLKDGNTAYLNAVRILVLRSVFKSSRSDTRVQNAALKVLEACSASVTAYRPLHLIWPLVIASSQVDAPARPWTLTVLEGLRTQCCFNVDSGEKIVREVWTRLDQGLEWTDWRGVVEDLDLKILLT